MLSIYTIVFTYNGKCCRSFVVLTTTLVGYIRKEQQWWVHLENTLIYDALSLLQSINRLKEYKSLSRSVLSQAYLSIV